jgi:hypothetical protein
VPEQPPAPLQATFQRSDDFVSRYANNAQYESFASDFRIVFGQSQMISGAEVIEQHTAITVAWMQVKLAIYYLQVNLAAYELQNGPVKIPSLLIPPPFPEQPPDQIKSDPMAARALAHLREIRERFVASLTRDQ